MNGENIVFFLRKNSQETLKLVVEVVIFSVKLSAIIKKGSSFNCINFAMSLEFSYILIFFHTVLNQLNSNYFYQLNMTISLVVVLYLLLKTCYHNAKTFTTNMNTA